jgi:hypothetical protein
VNTVSLATYKPSEAIEPSRWPSIDVIGAREPPQSSIMAVGQAIFNHSDAIEPNSWPSIDVIGAREPLQSSIIAVC